MMQPEEISAIVTKSSETIEKGIEHLVKPFNNFNGKNCNINLFEFFG